MNLETNNAIKCIEREGETDSETEIKMDDSNGNFINFLLIPFNLCNRVV